MGERLRIANARVPQAMRQGDAVAVLAQHETSGHRAGDGINAQLSGPQHRCERVSRVNFAVDNFFANRRPAHFATKRHIEAEFFE